ncbi:IucA/IucC family protein [Streptomyces roseochromogenus]|uniref:Iron transporter n=1 Tax=Streptomyces roseochromogenus subsp. oscitans DS 12.976 TaxID=1352936 RepID=V6KWK3_STRRC|nr:IucA/IucC family protein [Streptomyces roseochromogenus]EST36403.1 iron transporter [Streptomyces roseochromogenus subsp. oscitans DS 12.976]
MPLPTSTPDARATTGAHTADAVTAHTLLNCLIREVCAPEHQVTVDRGHLLLRLPRRGLLLRARLRRVSMIGAHRFQGPVERLDGDSAWVTVDWRELAGHVQDELQLRTGVANGEFLDQVADSRETIRTALEHRAHGMPEQDIYLTSEQSLVFGHRFHPTPKARTGDPADWLAYGPETGARFRLRHLAVRRHLVRQEGDLSELDALCPPADPEFVALPVHPWQFRLLSRHERLRAALAAGEVVDIGVSGPEWVPTASVRTLYQPDADTFLKFSLNVRLTNCVRKHARYELTGAVALNRLLQPVMARLAARFPGCALLAEPGYRTLATDGDTELLEGFGVVVRSGLRTHLRPGVTPLLAAAVADEYPTSAAHVTHLVARGDGDVLAWWDAYLRLLLPPVLAAYFEHGVVLEPHLQNVVVGVDADGAPVQILFRDLEGTKLLPRHHAHALAALPEDVRGPLTYDAERGWNRVAYCLLVNHVAEVLGALADLDPAREPALWGLVRDRLEACAGRTGGPPRLRALLSGVPLPAKANLLLRWAREADRHATYVPLTSPLGAGFPREVPL